MLEGWEWLEKKWGFDLWSREWVEERIIMGVEIEMEGERWVYDIVFFLEKFVGGGGGMGMIGEESEEELVRSGN